MITYKLFDKVSEKAGSQAKLKSQNASLWNFWYAQRDSNPRHRLRRPVLYPVELWT